MTPVSLLLNLLWMIFGGIEMALAWLVAAALMALTVIGLPFAVAAFRLAHYTLVPFGRTAVTQDEAGMEPGPVGGALGLVANLLWFILAGWWLALGHLVTAVVLALTIIGIPFAWAHLKLAALAVWPLGKVIVTDEQRNFIRHPSAWQGSPGRHDRR